LPGTIYDYFVRACRREIVPPSALGVGGSTVQGEDGNRARFWISAESGRIQSVQYGATSCTTLLGLCEHIVELVTGQELSAASGLTAERLLALHPEIPPEKQEASRTAVRAFHSAAQFTAATRDPVH
jgi:hypothetical protein